MYNGPKPKDINIDFLDHTYELVTCLLNGEQKKVIQARYLAKLGYTQEQYLEQFPGAPLTSQLMIDIRKTDANSEKGKSTRSANMRKLNLHNTEFQDNRKQSCKEFLQSSRSNEYRENARNKALQQHKTGHAKYVQKYFNDVYPGSDEQEKRRNRARENNFGNLPGAREKATKTWLENYNANKHFKKNYYKDSGLTYQSQLEYKFLTYMESMNLLSAVSKAPTLKDDIYPRRWYLPDYLLFNKYIVEIKSWYIEQKQLELNPNVTNEKKQLVERLGFIWLYIKDHQLDELKLIIELQS